MMTAARLVYDYLQLTNKTLNNDPTIKAWLEEIKQNRQPDQIEQRIQNILTRAQNLPGRYALTEAQVDLALTLDECGLVDKSVVYLEIALKSGRLFADVPAIHWTLGNQQYRIRRNESARWSLMRAIETLQYANSLILAQGGTKPSRGYADRLEWMYDHQFSTVEYVYYDCLYRYGSGRPNGSTFEMLAKQLLEQVECGQFGEARQIIGRMDTFARNQSQDMRGVTNIRAGMALWQMGNLNTAIERFLDAAVCYKGIYQHQEAFTNWMLGILEWEETGKEGYAIKRWERACELFEWLEQRADQRNQQDQRKWYKETRDRMRRMLMRRVSGKEFA